MTTVPDLTPVQSQQHPITRWGGGGGSEEMCTLHAGVMLCIVFVTMLPDMADDSSTSTIRLYLSLSQLYLIKRVSNFKVTQCVLNVGYSYSTFS
jgi:hypothetical protein